MSVAQNVKLHRANLKLLRKINDVAAETAADAVTHLNRVGASDIHVTFAQQFANDIGIKLPIDGVLGAMTARFVRTFQEAYCLNEYWDDPLVADGVPGPLTKAAMAHSRAAGYRISKDFRWYEFVTKNPDKTPTAKNPVLKIVDKLIRGLQQLRDFYGAPIVIVSGFRDSYWNTVIRGAKYSQHMLGKAADFHILDSNGNKVMAGDLMPTERVCARWFQGMGRHKQSKRVSHVDVRPNQSRWWYPGA